MFRRFLTLLMKMPRTYLNHKQILSFQIMFHICENTTFHCFCKSFITMTGPFHLYFLKVVQFITDLHFIPCFIPFILKIARIKSSVWFGFTEKCVLKLKVLKVYALIKSLWFTWKKQKLSLFNLRIRVFKKRLCRRTDN